MRLTLRTLLAYLDNVPLDAREAEELAKKIDESEFVRNLVQRIRTSVSRPRLSAPKVDGQGLGHDPNTVAAYLDNTLPQDRMPEFEKICLESDVLLSEVAACHQILALVLQQPAKVSPRLRERVYRIGDLGIAAPVDQSAASVTPPPPPTIHSPAEAAAPDAPPPEEKPQPAKRDIPEYLRETRSLGWKPIALTLALGFLLAAIGLRAMGPFDERHPVLGFLVGSPPQDQSVAQTEQEPPPSSPEPSAPAPPKPKEPMRATSDEGQDDGEVQESRGQASADEDEPDSPAVMPSPAETPDVETTEPELSTDDSATADERTPVEPEAPPAVATTSGDEQPSVAPPPPAAPKAPNAPPEVALAPTSPTTEDPIPPPIRTNPPPIVEAAPASPPPAAEIGLLSSEKEVLAHFQPDAAAWLRLPSNAPLAIGDRLLALPAYRPKIVLASGFQVTIGGGTLIEIRSPQIPGEAHLGVEYGRLVVTPVGATNAPMRLNLWGREGTIRFAGPSSLMAVQLRRYRAPGIDPEAGWSHRLVEIYAVGGALTWRESGHPEQVIQAGETFAFLDDARGGVSPTTELPVWVNSKDIERSDELAAQEMETLLPLERPLSLTLLELSEHRKSEVRALAVRCLGYLDLYEKFVDMLNDETQRSYWDDHFNELQRALARSPEAAREVRIAFEKVRGRPAATELYRLLWSYSPDDLANNSAAKLVGYLAHESLDMRVLAIENLRRITGNTHLYRPEVAEVRRRTPIQRWRASLEANEVQYREKVLMLPPRILDEPDSEPAPAAPTIEEPEASE